MFSRLGLVILLLVLQVLFLLGVFKWFEGLLPHIWGATVLMMAGVVIYLLNSRIDPSAKMTWLIIILLMPVFGALLFWYTQSEVGHRALKMRMDHLLRQTKEVIPQSEPVMERFSEATPGAAALAKYISRTGCYPVYENTEVTYFPLGEYKFEEMLRQLEKAQKYIFLEYFIVDEGVMWGRVLDVLKRKAKEGVDVRVMYDGTCEFSLLPRDYPKRLKKLGIKCKVFAPLTPFVSTYYNYRDHRKIMVIDGHTAFNGGVNLADEYINEFEKHGHWKDTAVMLRGDAAKSFTLMFLQMWNITEREPVFDPFLEEDLSAAPVGGFVMPYGDCPLDGERVGERVYLDMLNRAQSYVHIMSPYLILDAEMENALRYAAERGVEVSLILPGIPDKKIPYALAKTHYSALLDAGVHIYEYMPGFVHAKVFVADGKEAVVGTINLDYRSLYHHFECATYMNGVGCIPEMEDDYKKTRDQCRSVVKSTIWEGHRGLRVVGAVLKAVAPLL
ncbi:MAG: cardiolipin synthase [Clostridiales bacterium]|nr:cardiolipin synthase [Clostridiales bacterium]